MLPNGGYREDGLKRYSGKCSNSNLINNGDLFLANTDIKQSGSIIGNVAKVPSFIEGGKILLTHHMYALRFKKGYGEKGIKNVLWTTYLFSPNK